MGFRFQRRVTLFPGVRLNFSARGISASIGPRGASLTFGPRGTALNLGIPGTGLSFRQNLSPAPPQAAGAPPSPAPEPLFARPTGGAIESESVVEVTSESLAPLKQLILKVIEERADVARAIPAVRKELAVAERRLRRARNWFFGLFLKKKVPERQAKVEEWAAALKELQARHDGAFVDTEFALDEATCLAFDELAKAFEQVASCARIWDITSETFQDRRVTRSSASRTLERKEVQFSISDDPILQTESKVLQLQNANGADLLVYPGFVLIQDHQDLALVDLREMQLSYNQVPFVEEDQVPADALVIDHTWAKCNKDGSPDRRFANNYRIPVAGYGRITLKTADGVNEEYQFSNSEKAHRFAELFGDYQNKLRVLGARAPAPAAAAAPGRDAVPPAQLTSAPTEATVHAVPPPSSSPFELGSLQFLRAAEAMSAEHAIKVLQQFIDMFKADVATFSDARHTMPVFERFANDVATVPGAVQEFLRRAPGTKSVAPQLTKVARDLVRDVLAQIRTGIEQADASATSTPEAAKALRTIREAEAVLRK